MVKFNCIAYKTAIDMAVINEIPINGEVFNTRHSLYHYISEKCAVSEETAKSWARKKAMARETRW